MTQRKYHTLQESGAKKPVLVEGIRTPFVKSFGVFQKSDTLELFSRAVDGLLRKSGIDPETIDEITAGVVIPQTKNMNVARDAIINLGLPHHIHGYALNRACTSSLQCIANASAQIKAGQPATVIAGGVECLSDVPITYSKKARSFLLKLSKAKSVGQKLGLISEFKMGDWVPKPPALAEAMTGLTMGQHAEIMAKLNEIPREDQDQLAMESHHKAAKAQENGTLAEEICPVWPSPNFEPCVDHDNIVRADTSLEALAGLRTVFDKKYGSLTAGNSSPLTDGAAACLIMDEATAKGQGLTIKSRIVDYAFVGVTPYEQLLIGPAVAIPILLKRNNLTIDEIDLFEIHEAFAAQVLSCIKSMESSSFNERYFGEAKPFGSIPREKLNVNGGAIAIGHPFGATGSRLVTSISNELLRREARYGVVAICAAGAMAGAMLIENYRS